MSGIPLWHRAYSDDTVFGAATRRCIDHTALRTLTHEVMRDPLRDDETMEPVPLGQRLFDNVFLLLAVGFIIMFAVYTAWGLWEIYSLPKATLP